MNDIHEANRRGWDAISASWQAKVDAAGIWRRCHIEPELVFAEEEMAWLTGVGGKQVAVLGSGDNLAVFALAGLGANVTSIDFSQEQLDCGIARSRQLGLKVDFMRADVTDLCSIPSEKFDIVYTGGHVAVWVENLGKYYSEAIRILVPKGLFIVSEYHPFRRVVSAGVHGYDKETRYLSRGPFEYDRATDNSRGVALAGPLPSYEFHWSVGDFINAIIVAGCEIVECQEFGEKVEPWEGLASGDIPATLMLVARKSAPTSQIDT